MKNNLLKQKLAVEKLKGRGKNILVIGPTGVGKTHLINSIVPNILKVRLSIREGEGLATLKTTTTILSDYVGLNENEIIITGNIKKIDKYDRNVISECEKLLLDIIYEPVKMAEKELTKIGDYEKSFDIFKSAIEVQIDNFKMYNDNTKLAYIIKNIDNYDKILKDNIFDDETSLKKNMRTLIDIYRRTKANAKALDIKRVFIDEIAVKAAQYVPSEKVEVNNDYYSDDNLIRKLFDKVVDTIVNIYNSASKDFLDIIANNSDSEVDSNNSFILTVNDINYTKNADLLKKLIGVGNDTRGYFVESPTIYLKKDFKEILNAESEISSDCYKTFVEDDVDYYSMRIIDTQGLFHKNEDTETECERIIDLLSIYQCNDIIYIISAKNDALTKKAKEVLKYLKNTCKKNINVNLAVTHIDEKIASKINSVSDGDFGDFDSNSISFDNVVNDTITEQNVELWNELINDNRPGKVAIDSNISYFSYPTYKESIDANIKGLYDYNSNVNRLLLRVAKNSRTYYIELESDGLPSINVNNLIDNILGKDLKNIAIYDVSNIYYNILVNYYLLFGTPKTAPLRIHHRTYEEAIANWKFYACKFKSEAKGNTTGYAPIETYFVDYIKSFIRESVVPKADINFENVKLKNQNDKNLQRFKDELINFLKDYVSKHVTTDIYDETVKGHIAVYDYRLDFMNILIECAKKFFPSERISLIEGEKMKNMTSEEMRQYFNDDNSNGLAKILILTITEINNAIEQFVKNYCVVRF